MSLLKRIFTFKFKINWQDKYIQKFKSMYKGMVFMQSNVINSHGYTTFGSSCTITWLSYKYVKAVVARVLLLPTAFWTLVVLQDSIFLFVYMLYFVCMYVYAWNKWSINQSPLLINMVSFMQAQLNGWWPETLTVQWIKTWLHLLVHARLRQSRERKTEVRFVFYIDFTDQHNKECIQQFV